MHTKAAIVAFACLAGFAPTSWAQAQEDYGIEFVTVGAPGNEAFNKPNWEDYPNSPAIGRGRVDYTFRMAKYETTTAQYLEFANTFYGVAIQDLPAFLTIGGPTEWGAIEDPTYGGPGTRWKLENNAAAPMKVVFGISWRDAALYCNWLNNGKSSDPASLLYGAYDVSTWGDNADGSFSDAWTHLPGAKYWLPTYDEALKASHYDPNRYGQGQGGWWLNKSESDEFLISGPPGAGQTSAGWTDGFSGEYDIPLGAYPDSLSPWGMLDTSGGTAEWVEEVFNPENPEDRGYFGSIAGQSIGRDAIYTISSVHPSSAAFNGVRLASAVPTPGWCALATIAVSCLTRSRTRKEGEQ